MSIRNGTSGSGRCEGDHHRIGGEAIGRFDWGHSIRASSRPPAFSVAHQVQIRPSLCCRQEVALPSSRGLDERPAPHGDRSMANAGWRRRHTPRDPEHQPLRARPLRTSDRRCHDRRGRRSPLAVAKRTPSRRTSATTSSPAIATGVATSHHAANAACCLSRRVRFVAFGIAGSRRVETIALPECDRPECGMVRRRRTAGFGRKAVAPRSVRRCVLQWQSDDWSLGRPWPPVPARLIRLSAAVRSWRVYLELNPVDAVHSRIQRGPIAVP